MRVEECLCQERSSFWCLGPVLPGRVHKHHFDIMINSGIPKEYNTLNLLMKKEKLEFWEVYLISWINCVVQSPFLPPQINNTPLH